MSGHEVEEGGAGGSCEPFTGRPLPLHSKKMTGPLLQRLGRGLEDPDTAPPDELRQAIRDKLVEMGRDPKTVQVRLQEMTQGMRIGLQDAGGIFLDLAPEDPEDHPDRDHTEESESGNAEVDLETVRKTLKEVSEQKGTLEAEVSSLQVALAGERERVKELWKANCMQLSEFDAALTAKDEEIERLREQLARSYSRSHSRSHSPSRSSILHESSGEEDITRPVRSVGQRRGKAPPVDAFTGKNPEVRLDDWLPALQRAAEWNDWSQAELLIQLAGHLRG